MKQYIFSAQGTGLPTLGSDLVLFNKVNGKYHSLSPNKWAHKCNHKETLPFLYEEMCRKLSAKNAVLVGKAGKQLIVSPSLGRMKNWCPGHSHNATFHPQEMGTVNTSQYKMVSKAVLSKNTSCQLQSQSETICKLVMISM